MKLFVKYTLARLGIFALCYAVIWAVAIGLLGYSVEDFDQISALSTALIALVVSSLISYRLLAGMRNAFALEVEARAARAKDALEKSKSAEDNDAG